MKQGTLYYDSGMGRYNFHYVDEEKFGSPSDLPNPAEAGRYASHTAMDERNYGGIHCGEVFEFNLNGVWVPARVEMGGDREWYLAGLPGLELEGLQVRQG